MVSFYLETQSDMSKEPKGGLTSNVKNIDGIAKFKNFHKQRLIVMVMMGFVMVMQRAETAPYSNWLCTKLKQQLKQLFTKRHPQNRYAK